jgi:arsenate reductase (glutaredoxin)
MSEVTIYHNPRCSKSRATLALLEERGIEPEVVLYLQNPPDAATIRRLLKQLNLEARELLRNKESAYTELGLDDMEKSAEELIKAMISNPILIERPIVVAGDRAAIGRPPENVLSLLQT